MLVNRTNDGPITVKRFHLFTDCGSLTKPQDAEPPVTRFDEELGQDVTMWTPKIEVVELTEREAALLGLEVCRACGRRAARATVEEVITQFLNEHADWTIERGRQPDELNAEEMIKRLNDAGYVLEDARQRR
jgi:hypothetical protein